jgi:CPA2 family monovalent cation:H+ antiporter-2
MLEGALGAGGHRDVVDTDEGGDDILGRLRRQNVARVLSMLKVPFVVVEVNPVETRRLRQEEVPTLHGDATQVLVLEAAGLERAQALVVTVADAPACRQIVSVARRQRPEMRIIARTRYMREVDALHRLGADDVVPEEYETSLELAGRVLATYGTPDGLIAREKVRLRGSRYQALVGKSSQPLAQHALRAVLGAIALEEITVTEGAVGAGRSLKELGVRERTGATVLAVMRGRQLLGNPAADLPIDAGDVLIVAGTPAELESARRLLAARIAS